MTLFPELPEIAEVVANPSSDDYAAAARYALKRKQRPLAVQQVAAALALDPRNHRHLQLLSEIVGTTPEPLALLRLGPNGTFYGVAAARAWMLAKRRDATEATRLLAEVVHFRPNTPFLAWLHEWQERFDWAERVAPDVFVGLLRGLVAELSSQGLEAGGEVNLEFALQAAEQLQRVHPGHAALCAARMYTHRQLDETEAALALAVRATPNWEVEIERACCKRRLGDVEGELQAWQRAVELRPAEPSTYLELASVWVRRKRRSEAVAVLKQASQRAVSPSNTAALSYLTWLEDDLTRVLEVSNDDAGRVFFRDSRCYLDTVPDPSDEAVGVVRGALLRAQQTNDREYVQVRAVVGRRAAPSAELAFELGLAALSKRGQLTLRGQAPATALGQLWTSEAEALRPSLPPPDSAAVDAVMGLAGTRFEWSRWMERATSAVATLTVAPLELVSAALHPPPAPAGADAVQWLAHVQVAVGVLLGALNDSVSRRQAVARCLAASDDWVSTVGIVALYAAVSAGTQAPADVQRELASLLDDSREDASCRRTLAVIGSLVGGPRRLDFLDLRAQLAFEGLERDVS